jgi:hypothetical protein
MRKVLCYQRLMLSAPLATGLKSGQEDWPVRVINGHFFFSGLVLLRAVSSVNSL